MNNYIVAITLLPTLTSKSQLDGGNIVLCRREDHPSRREDHPRPQITLPSASKCNWTVFWVTILVIILLLWVFCVTRYDRRRHRPLSEREEEQVERDKWVKSFYPGPTRCCLLVLCE